MSTKYEVYLAPRTWGANEPWLTIPVDCKLTKDDIDRYRVILRSTGQILGYVWQSETYNERKGAYVRSGDWKVGISNGAYYPADADVLTTCKTHESHRGSWHELDIVELTGDRRQAVNTLLSELARRGAESVEPLVEQARRPFIIAQAEAGESWAIRHLIEAAKQGA